MKDRSDPRLRREASFVAQTSRITDITGAILAGGKSSRMGGKDKALIQVEGRPLIHRTINLFKEVFAEVILVTNTPAKYKPYAAGIKISADLIKDIGPLGGIYTALSKTEKEAVFFTACDMPFLHNETIYRQIRYFETKSCDAFVPRIGSFIEPLHSIFKKSMADNILHFIKENSDYSIRNFLKTINVCYWDLEDTFFHKNMFENINREEDAAAIQRRRYEGEIKGLA